MPISKYYKGHGEEVMRGMKKRYGEKKGESVFYATANKQGKAEKVKHARRNKRGH